MAQLLGLSGLDRFLRLTGRLAICLALALVVAPMQPKPARADIGACASLVTNVSPSDLKMAYAFIKNHGECIPKLEDTTFQAITAGVAALQFSKVVDANTCGTLLDAVDSPAAQTVISIAGADLAYGNLNCACAVVNSGIAEKLKKTVGKIAECGETFDPTDALGAGLGAATGAIEELGETLGLHGNGTGAAEQTFTGSCPKIGVWMTAKERGSDGLCYCPTTTVSEWGSGALEGFMRCVGNCPPGEISDGQACKPCDGAGGSSGSGGGSSWSSGPNETRTQCVKSGGGFSCGDGKVASGGKCLWACPQGEVWDKPSKSCFTCPQGTVPTYVSGAGSMGACKPCGPNQQVVGGQCQTCPSGSVLNEAGFCQSGFPPPACTGETIRNPGDAQSCVTCPPNQKPNASHQVCVPARTTAPIRPSITVPLPGGGSGVRPRTPSRTPPPIRGD